MKFVILIICVSLVECQFDGGFWWKNKKTMRDASESRSLKEQSARIRTLPPRYRGGEGKSSTTTVKSTVNIFGDDEEEQKMFKYDDEPDCSCVPVLLCNENNTIITDGNGIIDER
jgi:Serine protease Clip domain PPAF-2